MFAHERFSGCAWKRGRSESALSWQIVLGRVQLILPPKVEPELTVGLPMAWTLGGQRCGAWGDFPNFVRFCNESSQMNHPINAHQP